MRNYPIDSSKAQARIIVAAMLADGGLDKSELELLATRSILDRLDMSESDFNAVLHGFWNDTNQYSLRHDSGELRIGHDEVSGMLAEIRSKSIQLWLLGTIFELCHVDQTLNPVESQLISQIMLQWKISLLDVQANRRTGTSLLPPQVRRAVAEACS